MLYMVVERYREGAAPEIYRRAQEKGRMIPDGLEYVSSWVNLEFTICYQLMRTDDASLFAVWTDAWKDLVDFEIVPVRTSAEAARVIDPNASSPVVTALHHVNVTVSPELEREAKEFYGGVLGLKQVPKPTGSRQSGAWYEIGANQLHLSVENESGALLSSRHVCFSVSDLRATETRFREAGVEIISAARPVPGTSRFYVRDPGGNMLEITQSTI